MAEFAYTFNTGSLKKFFPMIQTIGKPNKVDFPWVSGLGFSAQNDRNILNVLRFLGFVDNAGVPTELWNKYRNKTQSRIVMAQAIREAYASLFASYPDAYRKDVEALRAFFDKRTNAGDSVIPAMARTFTALITLANFESENTSPASGLASVGAESILTSVTKQTSPEDSIILNVNIQLQLPATEDISIYDKLFASLKKHLLS